MRVVILQPSYLPWLGYFDQMSRADKFVFLDNVQFTRRDWRNRNKIRTKEGGAWLTVPIVQKGKYGQSLLTTRIDNSIHWRRKHKDTLRHNYSQAPYFDLYFPFFEKLYAREWEFLLDICYESLLYLKDALNIETPVVKSSSLGVMETKGERVYEICHQLGATHYLSGDVGRNYLFHDAFLKHGVSLEFHNYKHPVYQQRFPGFIPYLSVVDLLFNFGEQSLDILRQQNGEAEVPNWSQPDLGYRPSVEL